MRKQRVTRRGIVLLSSYLVVTLFVAYSGALAIHSASQNRAVLGFRNKVQALNLAHGSADQLREDLYKCFLLDIYQTEFMGDAMEALEWLENIPEGRESPRLDIPTSDRNQDGMITMEGDGDGRPDGTAASPMILNMPAGQARAWVVDVVNPDPTNAFGPRNVVIEAESTIGGVTKRIRATYQMQIGMSDVFRYVYFVNNYGWFAINDFSDIKLNGEIRANGNLTFSGNIPGTNVQGDLYAAKNDDLKDPVTGTPATGEITGDPNQWSVSNYWKLKPRQARPTRDLTLAGQPPIGGKVKTLDEGYGWDAKDPEQARNPNQKPEPIPYLGKLDYYRSLAVQEKASLTYNVDKDKDGIFGETGEVRATLKDGIWYGPDGKAGTADDTEPLVLVGTSSRPINLNGPIVASGDVIIKGYVTGRGTIYSARNVHVIGQIIYKSPPEWPAISRQLGTGKLRDASTLKDLGTVCDNGKYYKPGKTAPTGCAK